MRTVVQVYARPHLADKALAERILEAAGQACIVIFCIAPELLLNQISSILSYSLC